MFRVVFKRSTVKKLFLQILSLVRVKTSKRKELTLQGCLIISER